MGSAFVVVTNNDLSLAREQADQLAEWLVNHRELFRGELISPEDALAKAAGILKTRRLARHGRQCGRRRSPE